MRGMATYIRLNTPVPVKVLQTRMFVEEAAIPAAHVPITYHPALTHADSAKIFETVHEATLVNEVR